MKAMGYNKVLLIGRLARDPEIKTTQNGKQVALMTIAVNRNYKKTADGNAEADFIPLVAWEKTAEICGRDMHKGSLIHVDGRLTVKRYDDQNGSAKFRTEVIVSNIEMLGKRPEGSSDAADQGDKDEDDIPF